MLPKLKHDRVLVALQAAKNLKSLETAGQQVADAQRFSTAVKANSNFFPSAHLEKKRLAFALGNSEGSSKAFFAEPVLVSRSSERSKQVILRFAQNDRQDY